MLTLLALLSPAFAATTTGTLSDTDTSNRGSGHCGSDWDYQSATAVDSISPSSDSRVELTDITLTLEISGDGCSTWVDDIELFVDGTSVWRQDIETTYSRSGGGPESWYRTDYYLPPDISAYVSSGTREIEVVVVGYSIDNDSRLRVTLDADYEYGDDWDGDGEIDEALGGDDCDDSDPTVYTGATEGIDDGVDQDCDGQEICYDDADDDGYRTSTTTFSSDLDCSDAGEGEASDPAGDCNDGDKDIHPGATEVIGDEIDQDCDNKEVCYVDDDEDDYRVSTTVVSADDDCSDTGEAPASMADGDCNDSESSIHPGATEIVADEIDQDCDGNEVCYVDDDNDGYRPDSTSTLVSDDEDCADDGEALGTDPDTDCDDGDPDVHPGAPETTADGIDQDCDGSEVCYVDGDDDSYRTSSTVTSSDDDCDDAGEAYASDDAGDCDDGDRAIHPGATEVTGDEIDQDCDGAEVCYVDGDGDGFRLDTTVTSSDTDCDDAGEADSSASSGDCNDSEATVYPGATEVTGDGIDQDCDGDEICFVDDDDDGYRPDSSSTVVSDDVDCDDKGEATSGDPVDDCNDDDKDIHPGATERIGDEVDQDCDGEELCYADADGDGFRLDTTVVSTDLSCTDAGEAPAGGGPLDCDDASATVYPDAEEIIGDEIDQDCDGEEICYTDEDGDGHGVDKERRSDDADCADDKEASVALPLDDCDDKEASVYPGADEIAGNGVDEDCDGFEACYTDADNDGFPIDVPRPSNDMDCEDDGESTEGPADGEGDCNDDDGAIYPGATELAGDEIDQDCDGRELCLVDADLDGFRAPADGPVVESEDLLCADDGEAALDDPEDCEDADDDPLTYPGARGLSESCEIEVQDDGRGFALTQVEGTGCSCDSTSSSPLGALPLLGLFGLALRRRRRSR